MIPLFGPETDKILYGLFHSGIAVLLVRLGGYRLFSKVMGVCIALMFVVVLTTAIAVRPPWQEIGAGLFLPTIPDVKGDSHGPLHSWEASVVP
jgi:Mn2+/Fe2+ NRAMP family transporter